jgi:hypothetical protein
MRAFPLAANVCVKGEPIYAAELLQGLHRLAWVLPARRRQDNTPMRLGKLSRASAVASRTWFGRGMLHAPFIAGRGTKFQTYRRAGLEPAGLLTGCQPAQAA